MSTPSENTPLLEQPCVQDQMVVTVVRGQVRIHSLKQAQQAPDPEARQVFAGSPAELAVFFRDIQAGGGSASDASTQHADHAGNSTPA